MEGERPQQAQRIPSAEREGVTTDQLKKQVKEVMGSITHLLLREGEGESKLIIHLQGELGAGRGSTSVVYKGVTEEGKEVAVKVALPTEEHEESLIREWNNLRKLAALEEKMGTHFFPRVVFPQEEKNLRQTLISQGRPDQRFCFLVEEFIPFPALHDWLIKYEGLSLPEPLFLEVARQYAKMLTIIHSANIACADRKLADLHWQGELIKKGDFSIFQRWKEAGLGRLMVPDWNVTGKASKDAVRDDLERFGRLCSHMALGEVWEGERMEGEIKVLLKPLEQFKRWKDISYGTQQILRKLIFGQYENASEFLKDVENQIALWQDPVSPLFQKVFHAWDSNEGLDKFSPNEIIEALSAASILYLRTKEYGGWYGAGLEGKKEIYLLSLEKFLLGLKRKIGSFFVSGFFASDVSLYPEKILGKLKEVEEDYVHDVPAFLYLKRLQEICELNKKDPSPGGEAVSNLVTHASAVFYFDRPELWEEGNEKLTLEILDQWRQEKEKMENEEWRKLFERIIDDADYRLSLTLGRDLARQGKIMEANFHFQRVKTLRNKLEKDSLLFLDSFYGDPKKEIEEATQKASSLLSVEEAIGRANFALLTGAENIEEVISDLLATFHSVSGEDQERLRPLVIFCSLEEEFQKFESPLRRLTALADLSETINSLLESKNEKVRESTEELLKRAKMKILTQLAEGILEESFRRDCLNAIAIFLKIFPSERLAAAYKKAQEAGGEENFNALRQALIDELPVSAIEAAPDVIQGELERRVEVVVKNRLGEVKGRLLKEFPPLVETERPTLVRKILERITPEYLQQRLKEPLILIFKEGGVTKQVVYKGLNADCFVLGSDKFREEIQKGITGEERLVLTVESLFSHFPDDERKRIVEISKKLLETYGISLTDSDISLFKFFEIMTLAIFSPIIEEEVAEQNKALRQHLIQLKQHIIQGLNE